MAFDLKQIREELAAAPIYSPIPPDLAAAIVDDCLRMANLVPVPAKTWRAWTKEAHKLWSEQLGMLAHVLATTSLREETVTAIRARPAAAILDPAKALTGFFEAIKPLTAEMIRANAFRQEECLRMWIAAWGGAVAGETPEESAKRSKQIDYRDAVAEFERADQKRKEEAKRRAKALREAAEREAAARGWRE